MSGVPHQVDFTWRGKKIKKMRRARVFVRERISINGKERGYGQEEQNWELVALSRGVEANQIL